MINEYIHYRKLRCNNGFRLSHVLTDARLSKVLSLTKLWRNQSCQKRLQARMNRWFGKDADGCTLSPHSLRHLKATTLARKGCPIKLAALLLDASPTVLMKTYQNFSQDDIDSACRDYKNDYK